MEGRALIPRRHQPVRGERRGQGPADHETEMPRPGAGDEAGIDADREVVDHPHRIHTVLGQRTAQPFHEVGGGGARRDRSLVQPAQVGLGVPDGGLQGGGAIGHLRSIRPGSGG